MSDGSAPPSGLSRPPAPEVVRLGVAVLFLSLSGPTIAATAAPGLATACWRRVHARGLPSVWGNAGRWSAPARRWLDAGGVGGSVRCV